MLHFVGHLPPVSRTQQMIASCCRHRDSSFSVGAAFAPPGSRFAVFPNRFKMSHGTSSYDPRFLDRRRTDRRYNSASFSSHVGPWQSAPWVAVNYCINAFEIRSKPQPQTPTPLTFCAGLFPMASQVGHIKICPFPPGISFAGTPPLKSIRSTF